MPFTEFTVPRRTSEGTGFGASLKKPRGGGKAALSFIVRESTALALGLADKQRLVVHLGDGEHHGLVRLRKDDTGSAIVIRRVAGRGSGTPYFMIALGHVPNFVDRTEAKRWCQFEVLAGDVIEVVLPSWADETGRRRDRDPRALSAPAALQIAPPPSIVSRLAGDPPKGRSALDQALTRGEARRQAEAREAAEHVRRESEARESESEATERLAVVMRAFGLTKAEAQFMQALLPGRAVTKEALYAAIDRRDDEVDIKIVDVLASKVRKKLRPHGVEIETVWGTGYRLAPDMAARAEVLIAGIDGGAPTREDDEAELAALAAAEAGDNA